MPGQNRSDDRRAETPRTKALVGQNAWLVDEMYEQYKADPSSVSASWQEFFADYGNDKSSVITAPRPAPAATPAPAVATAAAPAPARATAAPTVAAPAEPAGEAIRGAAARIVANMEASLTVPTATSFREVPARLLEVNRSVINAYLQRTRGTKVSFTHLIGYAVVRAIADSMPVMNNTFVTDASGAPRVVRNEHLNLGIAVDVTKADGSDTLHGGLSYFASHVAFAGVVTFDKDGNVVEWNADSGTYKPDPNRTGQAPFPQDKFRRGKGY